MSVLKNREKHTVFQVPLVPYLPGLQSNVVCTERAHPFDALIASFAFTAPSLLLSLNTAVLMDRSGDKEPIPSVARRDDLVAELDR